MLIQQTLVPTSPKAMSAIRTSNISSSLFSHLAMTCLPAVPSKVLKNGLIYDFHLLCDYKSLYNHFYNRTNHS